MVSQRPKGLLDVESQKESKDEPNLFSLFINSKELGRF